MNENLSKKGLCQRQYSWTRKIDKHESQIHNHTRNQETMDAAEAGFITPEKVYKGDKILIPSPPPMRRSSIMSGGSTTSLLDVQSAEIMQLTTDNFNLRMEVEELKGEIRRLKSVANNLSRS